MVKVFYIKSSTTEIIDISGALTKADIQERYSIKDPADILELELQKNEAHRVSGGRIMKYDPIAESKAGDGERVTRKTAAITRISEKLGLKAGDLEDLKLALS